MQLPKYNQGAGAPDIKDGLQMFRFDGIEVKNHPEWAGNGNFASSKNDNGDRVHFYFTYLTKKGEVVYKEGDPVELDIATSTSTGPKSSFFALYSGICTPAELAAWQKGALSDEDAEAQVGRAIHAKVIHKENGWPTIESVVGLVEED